MTMVAVMAFKRPNANANFNFNFGELFTFFQEGLTLDFCTAQWIGRSFGYACEIHTFYSIWIIHSEQTDANAVATEMQIHVDGQLKKIWIDGSWNTIQDKAEGLTSHLKQEKVWRKTITTIRVVNMVKMSFCVIPLTIGTVDLSKNLS